MTKEQVIEEIEELIKDGKDNIISTKWYDEMMFTYRVDGPKYTAWQNKALSFLNQSLPKDNDLVDKIRELNKNLFSSAEACVEILQSIKEYVEKDYFEVIHSSPIDYNQGTLRVFERFHRVARQLRARHENRSTLEVNDEYDVQDLLHALLRIYYDDIRGEEWTPSYAGKSARMDFLLKEQNTVIEVKKTRDGLTEKTLGDQLIVDIERYQKHPNCKKLICFIYDPEGRVGNPEGFTKDIENKHDGFVKVIIQPVT